MLDTNEKDTFKERFYIFHKLKFLKIVSDLLSKGLDYKVAKKR